MRLPGLPSRPSSCSRLLPPAQARLHDNLFGLGSGTAPAPWPFRAPRWPLRARLLPSDGVFTPQTSSSKPLQARLLLPAASAGPRWPRVGLSRARSCSRRPLRAQLVAQSASAAPAPASPRPLQWPDFLRSASPGPAPPACHWPLQANPCSRLWAPSSGPAQDLTSSRPRQAQPPASRRPARAQPLPPNGLSTPSSRLTAVSPGQISSCISAALPGPAPASQWPP
nr:putative uncharacterized protein FLJ46235 [Macaca nemestrina]